MSVLFELRNISHYYGNNSEFVIAGGGNTSYKNNDNLWVKSSGISLADIDKDGFVCLSREKLEKISGKIYPAEVAERERAVKEDLMGAVIPSDKMPAGREAIPRPSVETPLHNIIQHAFVVHTHPTLVNALLCSANACEKTSELFGDKVVFIEYTDPGYTLFVKTSIELDKYRKLHGSEPEVIFLQNHGMIVGADNIDRVIAVSDKILNRITENLRNELPDAKTRRPGKLMEDLIETLSSRSGRTYVSARSSLVDYFVSDPEIFKGVGKPFTPDDIVYCRSDYLFVNYPEKTEESINEFEKATGYYPVIIAVRGHGLIASGISHESAGISLEIFVNMMKVSFLSHNFGGPMFLSDKQIDFIDNWESENYRRKILDRK